MIAQINNVSPSAWHTATLIIIGLVAFVALVGSIKSSFFPKKPRIEPQPFPVSMDDPPVLQSAFDREIKVIAERYGELTTRIEKVATRVDENESYGKTRRQAIYTKIEAVQSNTTAAVEKLHEKVNPIAIAQAETAGQLRQISRDIAQITKTQETILQKLP